MSLDIDEEKVVIQLIDGSLSINKNLLENPVLSNLGNADGYIHHIDLSMSDFLPILSHMIAKPIENQRAFFNTCQYLGEIDLPIHKSKDSSLIQKWSLTPRLLVQCELEQFLLAIYTEMDTGLSFSDAYLKMFTQYTSNLMNNKLNEKSGGRLFSTLRSFHLNPDLYDTKESGQEPKLEFLLHELSNELLAEHKVPDSDLSYPTLPRLSRWWRENTSPNTFSISKGLNELKYHFYNFPFQVGNGRCVIAGGFVISTIANEERNAYAHSDRDIFLITRDEDEAKLMIHAIHTWVENLRTDFFITRTKNSVSFTTSIGIFQVITRLYHDIVQLLSGFDLTPCCIAYDGKRILTTSRGLDCFKTNKFHLLSWKQSETMAWRCKKIRMRRFEIMIPGLTMDEFNKEYTSSTLRHKSILKKIIHAEGKRQSDYDENPFHEDSVDWMVNKIREGIRFGYARQIQVLTQDINTIFDTSLAHDDFTIINTGEKDITFVKEMAHKQSTGSFNPTSEDFFDGIKW